MKTLILATAFTMSGLVSFTGASAQTSDRNFQAYGIIDVQTDVRKEQIMSSLERAARGFYVSVQTNRPIMVPVPEEPRRFELSNPVGASGLGAFASMAGVSAEQFKVATCEGAVWTGFISRNHSGANLRIWLCLFPYRNAQNGGYQLNYYAQANEERGGPIGARIGRAINHAVAGTPREWAEQFFRNNIIALEDSAGTRATLIEGEPEVPNLFRHGNGVSAAEQDSATNPHSQPQEPINSAPNKGDGHD